MSTHNMFVWRDEENYILIIIRYPPYLFYCVFIYKKMRSEASYTEPETWPQKYNASLNLRLILS